MRHSFFQKIQIAIIKLISKIHWGRSKKLPAAVTDILKAKFEPDYFIIATRRNNELSTFFINLGNFMLTGKWGFYSHVLMNLEDEVKSDDFRFIEATGKGTHFSGFEEVFGKVSSVALIQPANMTVEEWTAALDRAKTYLGTPYDNLFDLKNTLEINCVELIRLALQGVPGYETKFAAFEQMVKKRKKLTPQMFLDCPDFRVTYEYRT